jgi:hypothetical protein
MTCDKIVSVIEIAQVIDTLMMNSIDSLAFFWVTQGLRIDFLQVLKGEVRRYKRVQFMIPSRIGKVTKSAIIPSSETAVK